MYESVSGFRISKCYPVDYSGQPLRYPVAVELKIDGYRAFLLKDTNGLPMFVSRSNSDLHLHGDESRLFAQASSVLDEYASTICTNLSTQIHAKKSFIGSWKEH